MTSERQPVTNNITPILILVGSDKGGVGKTMISRALIDGCNARSVNLRVIDTETPNGALKRFYPQAELIDITQTQGQMRVFDELGKAAVTIVDMKAGILSTTLRALDGMGLLADVANKKIRLAVVHILGSSPNSLDEIAPTETSLKDGGVHFLVRNCANDAQFEWEPGALADYFKSDDIARVVLNIPHLDGVTREAIDQAAVSFAAFVADDTRSRVQRGWTRKWLGEVFEQFDKAGINRLVMAS